MTTEVSEEVLEIEPDILEPAKSPYIFGIDLGTTNSSISVYYKGQATILKVGNRTTMPSVMSIRDNGEIVVGTPARNQLMIRPDETVASAKRHIGTEWSKEFKGCVGKAFTATDIAAEVLSTIVGLAQQQSDIDLEGTPTQFVVCIPANFTDDQKTATLDAAKLANLDVVSLVEEPVAAAIAYALDRDRNQTILVYDLGGGTFDVSILAVTSHEGKQASLKVLAKEGVEKLGGDDFDQKLIDILSERFKTISGIDVLDMNANDDISKKVRREAQQKLKLAAEKAKIELTEADDAQIDIAPFFTDGSNKTYDISETITRSEFNDAVHDLVLQSEVPVRAALAAANLDVEDISRIILVGGSTKMPIIRETLTTMLGRPPYSDLDPDTVVARGAAIYGHYLTAEPEPKTPNTGEATAGASTDDRPEEVQPLILTISQIVTHNLGIAAFGGKFSRLIEKNAEIPPQEGLRVSRTYTTSRDNQTSMTISVYQALGEIDLITDDGAKSIGEFILNDIPAKPKGEEEITVEFEIDQQNKLTVLASSVSAGSSASLPITVKH